MDKILILDFGSQYTQLIARRIRENQVYCEIHPFNLSIDKIKNFDPKAIILSGGPSSVYDEGAPKLDKSFFDLTYPILGICYGMQLMSKILGGEVEPSQHREYGKAVLKLEKPSLLFEGVSRESQVWMSHGDKVVKIPSGFSEIGSSDNCKFVVVENPSQKRYGVQFHPEVVHTLVGDQILKNFLFKIATCKANWTLSGFIESEVAKIRKEVGKDKVLCAVSGGVDSTVAAVLLHKAIGEQLTCIFIDNGVLRKNEAEKVQKVFRDNLKINLIHVNAADRFLSKLKGIEDPEKKRKTIGNEFIYLFEEEAAKIKDVKWLVQGTLYPDVIESVSFKGPSVTIKTHHNVGGLPEKMGLKLIEPLRELFKDEVRALGKQMGIPQEMIGRQPFPGPGLAIRILGEVNPQALHILREADDVVATEIKNAGLYYKIWQSFAVLLPVKTVGVMGDERTYENVIALRCVTSMDGMTADWVPLPSDLLGKISNRIINEVKGVNRVVYDISSKPPATIEWE